MYVHVNESGLLQIKMYEIRKDLFAQEIIQHMCAVYLGLGGGAFTGHLSGAETA